MRVYGQDMDLLQQQANAVRDAVARVPDVSTAEVVGQTKAPTIKIQVDLAAADSAGLKPGDVRRAATTLLSGIVVGSLFEDDKVFEVVVWSAPALRSDLAAIKDLPIDLPTGKQVRLGNVANVTISSSPTVIRREGVFRYADVAVDIRGDDLTSAARAIDAAAKSVPMPLEYRAEVRHDYADRLATQTRLDDRRHRGGRGDLPAAPGRIPELAARALIFITLPAAILGGALAAQAVGGMSIGTIFGFVTVLGITARSGILLVREFQRLERSGELSGQSLILHAASERLVPFLATTVATIAAFVPFLVLGDRPGYEVIRPMAIVLLGGLVTSTLLMLFIVPTLYRRVASSPQGDPAAEPVGDAPALEPSTA